jgi:large subunit ribosomal protein L9
MQVILLERVAKLGQMGETVRVRDGFARNFLLPRGKALRATEANKKRFENQRADLEARNLDMRKDAEKVSGKLEGKTYTIIRQAGEAGQLYGSVSPRDIAETIGKSGVKLDRSQIPLANPIKTLGLHPVPINLHPEVTINVTVNVARSSEEAERQLKGEVIAAQEDTSMDDLGLDIGAALAEAGGDR